MADATASGEGAARAYWLETLGCPKNAVDSAKLEGLLVADGLVAADDVASADMVVVNTCAFVEEARAESIEAILSLAAERRRGAELVVTGCLAEREGDLLVDAVPEIDRVAGFGAALTATPVPVTLGARRPSPSAAAFDLLELPRPAAATPWAYVKVAEGCDRACGFCAIPSFRGAQRSRPAGSVLAEIDALVAGGAREIVLVAQDLASYGRDLGDDRAIVPLVGAAAERAARVRLLYLYPSELRDPLIDAIAATGTPYFDLSLQHVSRPLLRRMRRWGDGDRFLERISRIRDLAPDAAFRSSFIVGYPGETEDDHDQLLRFLETAQLDWAGFFAFSCEPGTYAAGLDDHVERALVTERLNELTEVQDRITAARRDALIGARITALVDRSGVGRTHREAPEIDGVVHVPDHHRPGTFVEVTVTAAVGPDLVAS